jgi:hypothetical protein
LLILEGVMEEESLQPAGSNADEEKSGQQFVASNESSGDEREEQIYDDRVLSFNNGMRR